MQQADRNPGTTKQPWEVYDSPADIGDDANLSPEQKSKLIEVWLKEVEERLESASEGMPPHGQTDDDLSLLEKLRVELQKAGKTQ